MEQISGLGQFSNLNALSGLSGLKPKKISPTCNLVDLDFSVFPITVAELNLS